MLGAMGWPGHPHLAGLGVAGPPPSGTFVVVTSLGFKTFTHDVFFLINLITSYVGLNK